MFQPRTSRVLDKLRAGEYVYTFKVNLDSSRAAEIAALAGYDCVWVCDEHISSDASLWERQILACKAHNVDLMMRVQRGSYSDLVKPLELDASGLMVPHTMSAADAAQIARHTRFAPLGRRPVDGGNSDGLFTLLPCQDYFEFVNRNRFVLIQIEDIEAMAELDAICATPGIDIIFFGPADFSQSIGDNGNLANPKVIDAMKRVAAAARKHGKFAGTTTTLEGVESKKAMGYQFLCCGADVVALAEYCQRMSSALHQGSPRY